MRGCHLSWLECELSYLNFEEIDEGADMYGPSKAFRM